MRAALLADLDRLVGLRALGGRRGRLARRPPRLVLREAVRETRLFGRATFATNEILIIVHPDTTLADARATLLHELVHLAGHRDHGVAFKHALAEAAKEGFGVDVAPYERGKYKVLDRELESALWWKGLWEPIRWAVRRVRAGLATLLLTSGESR